MEKWLSVYKSRNICVTGQERKLLFTTYIRSKNTMPIVIVVR